MEEHSTYPPYAVADNRKNGSLSLQFLTVGCNLPSNSKFGANFPSIGSQHQIIEWNGRFRQISILAFIMFIVHESFTMTENKTNIEKAEKLLDILDKHMQEENCKHSPNDLFEEYEFDDSLKNN